MATRSELLDTRGWFPGVGPGLEGLAPGEPVPVAPKAPTYAVIFLDRAGRGYGAPRPVVLDCLPPLWTRLDPTGELGRYTRRTWVLTHGSAGVVYREQAPAPFQPTAYQPGGGLKQSQQRGKAPDVGPEEEWAP